VNGYSICKVFAPPRSYEWARPRPKGGRKKSPVSSGDFPPKAGCRVGMLNPNMLLRRYNSDQWSKFAKKVRELSQRPFVCLPVFVEFFLFDFA